MSEARPVRPSTGSACFYVDPIRDWRPEGWTGPQWVPRETCHLATDGTLEDLHAFAQRIAVPRFAFHSAAKRPHYDLRDDARARAVAEGALEVSSKELVRRCFLLGRTP